VRKAFVALVTVVVLAAGCGGRSNGVVTGTFSVPGGTPAELQRAGLNFAKTGSGMHGDGYGHTVRVNRDGSYTVTLPSGSYSVIGALAGHLGRVESETCGAGINVTVRANLTTRADFVCHATPVTTPASTAPAR
jgi:hypothetical protein